MHNGYKIINYDNDLTKPFLKTSYDKHESLAYGVDWCLDYQQKNENKDETVIASCSFYDKLLTVWKTQC